MRFRGSCDENLAKTCGADLYNDSPRSVNIVHKTFGLLDLARLMPGFVLLENAMIGPPPRFEVTTSIVVKASPPQVWQHVVAFAELAPPTDLLFQTGIAYPTRAKLDGQGVGAVRHCVFSTGEFIEPITTWDEPRLLRFDVRNQPPVMNEWSPYKDLRPPHLEHYLVSQRGQFLLTAYLMGQQNWRAQPGMKIGSGRLHIGIYGLTT